MPELPEIEHLKRTLEPLLIGSTIGKVHLRRRDVVTPFTNGAPAKRTSPVDLLAGSLVTSLMRHGKNLAIVVKSNRVLGVHLGMSGQMLFVRNGRRIEQSDHVHCIWQIRSRSGDGRLIFRDPRRFGGLWTFPSITAMKETRWDRLGPDALTIDTKDLNERLKRTRRPIKAALLEQSILAGVGNIYADEALFRARIHPKSIARSIPPEAVRRLARAIRHVLRAAVDSGGSTIRSYMDATGNGGSYAQRHQVYGRADEPCLRCRQPLAGITVAQRTTVFCPMCQPLFV